MNVGFLTNLFHLEITKSSRFFLDFLREVFGTVKVIPHEYVWLSLPDRSLDLLVVWQKLYSPEELAAFDVSRIVLVPMSDTSPTERDFWVRYRPFRILCFSSTFYHVVKSYGLDALHVRYYPPLVDCTSKPETTGLHAFFWPRLPEINWRTVKSLLGNVNVASFHLHLTEGVVRHVIVGPESDDVDRYNIRVSTWFDEPGEYRKNLLSCNVFFASRDREGIGMSFLEAMSYGLCVVSPWRPTANEYIQDGKNGLLYDPDNPQPLDFREVERLGKAARESAALGRRKWEASAKTIELFLTGDPPGRLPHYSAWIVVKGKMECACRQSYELLLDVSGARMLFRWYRKRARRHKNAVGGDRLHE